jgi:hypothetical protein
VMAWGAGAAAAVRGAERARFFALPVLVSAARRAAALLEPAAEGGAVLLLPDARLRLLRVLPPHLLLIMDSPLEAAKGDVFTVLNVHKVLLLLQMADLALRGVPVVPVFGDIRLISCVCWSAMECPG